MNNVSFMLLDHRYLFQNCLDSEIPMRRSRDLGDNLVPDTNHYDESPPRIKQAEISEACSAFLKKRGLWYGRD